MKFLLPLALCAVLYNANVEAMIGGTAAPLGRFPAHLSLLIANDIHCGGTIISHNTFLSAASCFLTNSVTKELRPLNQVLVRAGVIQINPAPAPISVQAIYLHPHYNPFNFENNIALVRIVGNFTIQTDAAVPAVDVAIVEDRIRPVAELCQVVGFNAPTSTLLQFLDQTTTTLEACESAMAMPVALRSTMMCTAAPALNMGPCNPSIGGGLYCEDVLTGIISHNLGCGAINSPPIYTSVRHYTEWIRVTGLRTDIPQAGPTPPPGRPPVGGNGNTIVASIVLTISALVLGTRLI